MKALNPRVRVIGLTDGLDGRISDASFIAGFDIVCLTDSNFPTIVKVNSTCRVAGKPFLCAGSLGINGYIFSDLLDHSYLIHRETTLSDGETKLTSEKKTQKFVPFDVAVKSELKHVGKRRLKKVSPMLWGALMVFASQDAPQGQMSADQGGTDELIRLAREQLPARGLEEAEIPTDLLKQLSEVGDAEFAPTCAIVGSILSQEVLSALGGKEAPMVNFMVFDGERCSGDIYALGVERVT